jgi:hypothetical protein
MEDQFLIFISPKDRVAELYSQALGFFSSPSTTRRATVEIFEPASKRDISTTELLVLVI